MTLVHRPLRVVGLLVVVSFCSIGLKCNGKTDPTPVITSLTLSSNSVVAGSTVQGTVTVDRAAPGSGATVNLTSSNPGVATVPGSVTVAGGAQSATFTVTGVSAGSVSITGSLGGQQAANLTVAAPGPSANFSVIPNQGTIATGQQCEVQSIPNPAGGSQNQMKCTFDGSSSVPQGSITGYIWRFPQAVGIKTVMTTNPRVQNETVTCGTFGTGNVGTAADRPVELEIVIPPVNPPPRVIQVTFVRNGPC